MVGWGTTTVQWELERETPPCSRSIHKSSAGKLKGRNSGQRDQNVQRHKRQEHTAGREIRTDLGVLLRCSGWAQWCDSTTRPEAGSRKAARFFPRKCSDRFGIVLSSLGYSASNEVSLVSENESGVSWCDCLLSLSYFLLRHTCCWLISDTDLKQFGLAVHFSWQSTQDFRAERNRPTKQKNITDYPINMLLSRPWEGLLVITRTSGQTTTSSCPELSLSNMNIIHMSILHYSKSQGGRLCLFCGVGVPFLLFLSHWQPLEGYTLRKKLSTELKGCVIHSQDLTGKAEAAGKINAKIILVNNANHLPHRAIQWCQAAA